VIKYHIQDVPNEVFASGQVFVMNALVDVKNAFNGTRSKVNSLEKSVTISWIFEVIKLDVVMFLDHPACNSVHNLELCMSGDHSWNSLTQRAVSGDAVIVLNTAQCVIVTLQLKATKWRESPRYIRTSRLCFTSSPHYHSLISTCTWLLHWSHSRLPCPQV